MQIILETRNFVVASFGTEPLVMVTNKRNNCLEVSTGLEAIELLSATTENIDEIRQIQILRRTAVQS